MRINKKEGAFLLQQGKVIAFPTETVYGMGVPLSSLQGVQEMFALKRRSSKQPFAVLISELAQVQELAVDLPEAFWTLAEHFFPGPLTLIVKKHPKISSRITGGRQTIGIRMPEHLIPLSLIKKVREPLVATSANLSGGCDPISYEMVVNTFGEQFPIIYEEGKTKYQTGSTIIDLTKEATCLREGAISKSAIQQVLQKCHQKF